MPTATAFTALGAGNGFPTCMDNDKVDVSGTSYPRWITLSGWSNSNTPSSDSEKKASIAESREHAMKLFWLINGVDVRIISGYTSGIGATYTDLSIDLEGGDYENAIAGEIPYSSGDPVVDMDKEPRSRVCYDFWWMRQEDGVSGGFTGEYLTLQARIYKMYDGSTDDESNFIGFGASVVSMLSAGMLFDLEVTFRGSGTTSRVVTFAGMKFYAQWSTADISEDPEVMSDTGGTLVLRDSEGTLLARVNPIDFFTF